jgi:hypothetical protein
MYRQGYFKSQEEEDAAFGLIMIAYQKERQRFSLLEYKLELVARSFERVAHLLRTDPLAVTFDGFESGAPILAATDDWSKTKAEVVRLKKILTECGWS